MTANQQHQSTYEDVKHRSKRNKGLRDFSDPLCATQKDAADNKG